MISIPLLLITLVGSFILLIWSADRLVLNALGAAQRWRISPALMGMTVLALGTSLPEILISALAAATDRLNMAVANIQGSNIANLGLVLGLVLCLAPLPGRFQAALAGVMTGSALLLGVFLWNLTLTRSEGMLLLVASLGWLYWMAKMAQHDRTQTTETRNTTSKWLLSLILVLLLVLVLISARALVWSASHVAIWLGLSERLIGLTLLAVGSSLPELVTTLAAAKRGEHGLVLGNLAGSNIINILLGVALLALLGPGPVTRASFYVDWIFMITITVMILLLWWLYRHRAIGRGWGILLLGCYTVYLIFNFGLLAQ